MPISKKITTLKEPLEIDLQLMASELDTSVKNMKFISKTILEDAIMLDAFDKLCYDIENGEGSEVTSFDDNTVLFEYLDEAIVVHTILGLKYILFDSLVTSKIESRMNSYR
jgi:hypothetical protein